MATNGIISFRQAGKLRYMDSTESEQERGITMKSSTASLFYNPEMTLGRGLVAADAAAHPKSYLINLIDSPGHVDFASDVSTAVRLCDGAVIVVDVVEGVCPQTRAVLRQAWNERLALVLLLNKIDRLFLELRLSPLEVYDRLLRVLEQVNSVLAEMFTADVLQGNYGQSGARKENHTTVRAGHLSDAEGGAAAGDLVYTYYLHDLALKHKQQDFTHQGTTRSEDQGQPSGGTFIWSTGLERTDDSHVYFSPDRGNVIFASATDSWGFRISDFLDFWSTRLKIPKKGLLKVLWGDYYLIPATGDTPPKVKGHARVKGKKPVFVQLIIDQLFSVYKIADKLGIQPEPRLLRSTDGRMVLRSILSTWLSLGPSIFQTVIDMCPSPVKAVSRVRAMYMFFGESATSLVDGPALPSNLSDESVAGAPGDEDLAISPAIDALQQCSSEAEAPVLIFVSKVFWTDRQKSLHSSQPPAPWPSDSTSTSVPTPSAKSPSTGEGSRSRAFALFSRPPTMPENPFVTTEFVALSRIYSGRVPEYLLDADASNFPLGPLHLSDADDFSSHDARSIFGTSPSSSSVSSALSRSLSGGSMDSNIRRVLRHVYVAEICDVVQFAGGQNNVTRLSDPNCPVKYLPAGNVVGLIGPSLIASLPKSGLLVSRLRLVASPEESTTDADMELLGEVRRGGPSGRRVLPLAGLAVWHGAPVVSLAVEPASATNPDDLTKLEQGLRLLERSDPCAEVTISPKGEYLLHAAGEVHMQKCLEDLTKYFAPDVEIHTSQFVVPFRETVTRGCPPTAYVPFDSYAYAQMQLDLELKRLNLIYDPEHEHCVRRMTAEERSQAAIAAAATTSAVGLCDQRQQSEADSMRQQQLLLHRKQEEPQGDWVKWMPLGMLQLPHCKSKTRLFIRVTAHPIPPRLLTWLETRATIYVPQLLRSLRHKSWRTATYIKKFESEFAAVLDSLSNTQDGDDALKTTAPAEVDYMNWATLKNQLVCFGPGQVGPNILFSRLRSRLFRLNTAWGKPVPAWVDDTSACSSEDATTTTTTASHIPFLSYGKTILRGFQMATEQGPLCGEPMRGVAFILEDIYAEDRHKLPTPTVLQGPSALVTVDSVTTGSEAAPLTEAQERKYDRKAEKSDVKEVEIQVTKKAEEDDPILMALRAKQAAAQMRQKSRRLGSLSWLDPDDGDETDEEDWDFDEDFEDDYGDGDGGKSGSSDSDGSDSAAEEDVQSVAPESPYLHHPGVEYTVDVTEIDCRTVVCINLFLASEPGHDPAGANASTVDADDGGEIISPKRQAKSHHALVDAPRQTWQASHDFGEDGKGNAGVASLCPGAAVPEKGKKIRLPELFYWKRRNDCEWLSDVTPGLLTPTMARACIAAFQACPGQRLVLSMYDVELQSRSDVLGRMYSVLRKHYGRIIGEDLREGEECFVIRARLPVIESFGLTSDLRKRTSGVVALPQLRPGGWEVLDIDPLQRDASGRVAVGEAHFKIFQYQQDVLRRQRLRPGKRMTVRGTTADESASSESEQDEELLLDEVNAQLTRLRNYIRSVRQRKGLCLNEQLVVSADKQRTLKKNK
ncbi:unnamed protein product [Schistocephalus solidus]|uniref:Tr-type G domain-containing protein n=1 Tax=Schistocephalus solidus TaxID=70667 RepID=A0A3P7DRD3_SCHSO|nr:unnamed protein product [Schistocephalus solidus]